MIALILSVICCTYLVLAFRVFDKLGINHLQATIVNYVACVITGSFVEGNLPDYKLASESDWFFIALILGASFIFFFNLMGWVATNIGMTVTSVAGKISMVIPVSLAFFLYDDEINFLKIIALILALTAVVLSSVKEEKNTKKMKPIYLLIPLFLFFGSGFNDTLVQYAQFHFLSEKDFPLFNMTLFAVAAIGGTSFLFATRKKHQSFFNLKTIAGGILLGVPNYFSLHFLLKALSTDGWNSSVVFPINNIGIVLLTGVTAFIFFKEKLSQTNLIGLALSLICIVLMIFGK